MSFSIGDTVRSIYRRTTKGVINNKKTHHSTGRFIYRVTSCKVFFEGYFTRGDLRRTRILLVEKIK